MAFIGREAELRYLEQCYEKNENQIVVVYGQKGVGKTALLKTFSGNKLSSYYYARSCCDREQRIQWMRELHAFNDNEIWQYNQIFQLKLRDCGPETKIHKKILILDEFHYLVKGSPDFFNSLCDFVHSSKEPVMVLLCSSAAGWIENSMIAKIGSDAAFISGFLKLREISASRLRELYPSFSDDDFIQLYAVLGGIPGLWKRLDASQNARQNLINHVINKYSGIYSEMSNCLLEELREPAVYNTILGVIASGENKLNGIYQHTGFSRAKISVYLKNLMEIDLIEKYGAGLYRINRSSCKFYFTYLYPNLSLMEEKSPEQFYREIIEDSFVSFVREACRKS